jgi:DNA polymerase III epsilon subunit-like protein
MLSFLRLAARPAFRASTRTRPLQIRTYAGRPLFSPPPVSVYSRQEPMRPLTAEDGPMVWIDCEMTGLDPRTNRIMEIAVGNMREVYETIDLMSIF